MLYFFFYVVPFLLSSYVGLWPAKNLIKAIKVLAPLFWLDTTLLCVGGRLMSLKVNQSVRVWSASNRFQWGKKDKCTDIKLFSSVVAPVFLHKGVCVFSSAQPPPTLSCNKVFGCRWSYFCRNITNGFKLIHSSWILSCSLHFLCCFRMADKIWIHFRLCLFQLGWNTDVSWMASKEIMITGPLNFLYSAASSSCPMWAGRYVTITMSQPTGPPTWVVTKE